MDITPSVQQLLSTMSATVTTKHAKQHGTGCEWTAGETKLLLDYYQQYFSQIGPMKKFKNKKSMFGRIAANITEAVGVPKTGDQCCSRYKTVMRRKRSAAAHNNKSGNSPCDVPFEDEIAKIRWLDDSLEPEELRDSSGIVSIKRPPSRPPSQASSQASTSQASTSQTSTSQEMTSQDSTSQELTSTKKEPEPKKPKLSASRMLEMRHFFDEMSRIQEEKEKKRTERENERRKRHEEKQEHKERIRQEKAKQHEEKMKLLSRFLGLDNE
ncbi:E3 ubiquitin-protein ligase BRE1A [Rhipicephalus sanguineus]|uniref:E3 ubiquitin-protein ligase BRE1A n=1 Tax=Rhipicephalus sanguineus TaxID=34632 RepID=UPI0020C59ECD|nr:E3 ubiquitin-protein ligase BRE1A [Rhipicephalus sanguineus]